MKIGRRDIIEIELGDKVEGSRDLFYLDVWLLGRHITKIDNVAYLKSLIAQAEDDLIEGRDLSKFSKYFINMSPMEAHEFILSTRDSESTNFDIENDEIYPNQRILNWGPNTDNATCFLIPVAESIIATIENHDNGPGAGTFFTGEIDPEYFNNTIKEFVESGAKKI
ncbi:hypothetical protein BTA51_28660 [Hahella sp. CCB-MM4]|uniref:hypothetical protein n=1 Tax=Hahella sp. (strain CCB-MM4) TaxID=1926491 RepID=UPI000B9B7B71|nr:hypothetical protein [Hahella sp. CCB-MM4]OZG69926.1 hypothetical protein BTA51_28660 [Hahella sp. CCB-MM4]